VPARARTPGRAVRIAAIAADAACLQQDVAIVSEAPGIAGQRNRATPSGPAGPAGSGRPGPASSAIAVRDDCQAEQAKVVGVEL
jgi:hypothetical protein